MTHMYIHDTLIAKILEEMLNDTTKAKLLENYGIKMICHETVGEWIMKLGFK